MKCPIGLMNFEASKMWLGGQDALEQTPVGQNHIESI
jgi:hypothetical protein